MPTFPTPDAARIYMQQKMNEGMICTQTFGIDGIDVSCRFAVNQGIPKVRTLPVELEVKQEIFPTAEAMHLPHELRDYQADAVSFALAHRHVIVEIPTGKGKSLISMAVVNDLMRQKPRRTLVIVPTQILLDQWINDGFKAAGLSATGVSSEGKVWGEHTVTTYQSAIRNLGMLGQFDIVIFDEVHHLFAPEYRKILFAVENKPYLIGLTATVREYGEEKKLQHQYFPNVFTRTIEEFQAGKDRIPIEVIMRPVSFTDNDRSIYDRLQRTITRANRTIGPVPEWPKNVNSSNEEIRRLARSAISAYADQKRLLTEFPDKIDVIINIIRNSSGQFIVFSDTIDGIQSIEKALRDNGISEGSIYSGVNSSERNRIITGLRNGIIRVLVGGSAITEGLDLPDISNAVFSSLLVKSSRTYVQRLGRVLRPVPGKTVKLFLVYVKDTLEDSNARKVRQMIGEG